MKKVIIVGLAVIALSIGMGVATNDTASAGEWNNARGYIHGEWDTPLPAASICAFNGLDEPDYPAVEDVEELDDPLWAGTPAGGHVQSGGQFVAMEASSAPGTAGFLASNGFFRGFGGDCKPGGGDH